jgi:GT2 family glycosyltransferase
MPELKSVYERIKPEKINIAVLTFNSLTATKLCISSLCENSFYSHNIFVLDNGSTDGSREWLAKQDLSNLFFYFNPTNRGVPGGRNDITELILPYLPTESYVIYCDNDLEFLKNWDQTIVSFMDDNPNVGIASCNGNLMRMYDKHRILLAKPRFTAPVETASGGFACTIRKKVIEEVGKFDENLGMFWHEDDDYAVRAQVLGYGVFCLPHVGVIHHEHSTGVGVNEEKCSYSRKNQAYLIDKWRKNDFLFSSGRIKKKRYEIAGNQLRSVAKDIFGIGFSSNMGNYYWMQQQSELQFNTQQNEGNLYLIIEDPFCLERTSVNNLIVTFSRYPLQSIPVNINDNLIEKEIINLKFSEMCNYHEVNLNLKEIGSYVVSFNFSEIFTPNYTEIYSEFKGNWSARLVKIVPDSKIASYSVVYANKTPLKKVATDYQVSLYAQYLNNTNSSFGCEHMINILKNSNIKYNIVPLWIDTRLIELIKDNPITDNLDCNKAVIFIGDDIELLEDNELLLNYINSEDQVLFIHPDKNIVKWAKLLNENKEKYSSIIAYTTKYSIELSQQVSAKFIFWEYSEAIKMLPTEVPDLQEGKNIFTYFIEDTGFNKISEVLLAFQDSCTPNTNTILRIFLPIGGSVAGDEDIGRILVSAGLRSEFIESVEIYGTESIFKFYLRELAKAGVLIATSCSPLMIRLIHTALLWNRKVIVLDDNIIENLGNISKYSNKCKVAKDKYSLITHIKSCLPIVPQSLLY